MVAENDFVTAPGTHSSRDAITHKPGLQSKARLLLTLLVVLLLTACSTGTTQPPTPVQGAMPTASTLVQATATQAVAVATATTGASSAVSGTQTAAVAEPPAQAQIPHAPRWARDSVLYQIFVRAFTPEGTFAAAKAKLPELKDMGISLIYLMPVHPIGKVNRKGTLGSPYSIADYMAIDPALGTEADLKAFVDTAHSLGMHVIMDLVANHTSWDNVLTNEHPDWYVHTPDGKFRPPNPDWTDVIQLDHSQPGLLQYMIDMTSHYVQADGVDGFRCDYSTGVPLTFWRPLRDALKKVKPDLFLLSENDDEQLAEVFDATYDQDTYKDLINAYLQHRPHQLLIGPLLDRKKYGDTRLRTRFLENHDHDRVAYPFQTQPAALRAASTYLPTTDDIPFIENGEEVGITQTLSLFEPDKINWAAGDQSLKSLFKSILGVRNANPALRHGDIADANSSNSNVLAFLRRSPEQQVLVLINFSPNTNQVTVDPQIAARKGKDLESGKDVDLSSGAQLAGWSWRIIELK